MEEGRPCRDRGKDQGHAPAAKGPRSTRRHRKLGGGREWGLLHSLRRRLRPMRNAFLFFNQELSTLLRQARNECRRHHHPGIEVPAPWLPRDSPWAAFLPPQGSCSSWYPGGTPHPQHCLFSSKMSTHCLKETENTGTTPATVTFFISH